MAHPQEVLLTPAHHPPPPPTLSHRGTTLFNRVLQALTMGQSGERQNSNNGRCLPFPGARQTNFYQPPNDEAGYSAEQLDTTSCTLETPSYVTRGAPSAHNSQYLSQTGSAYPVWQLQDRPTPAQMYRLSGRTHDQSGFLSGENRPAKEPTSPAQQFTSLEGISTQKSITGLVFVEAENKAKHPCAKHAFITGPEKKLKQTVLSGDKNQTLKPARPRSRHHNDSQDRKQSNSTTKTSDAASREEPFNTISALRPVANMNKEELGEMEAMFSQTEEVAATLLFSDGSTQLREVLGKRSTTRPPTEIEGACLAYPVAGALQYVFLPFDPANADLNSWCREQLLRMLANARVICYDGQELVGTLMSHFDLEDSRVWLNWKPLDTRIGAWLLDSDHPPQSFFETLTRFNMQPPAYITGSGEKPSETLICKDLALLGPLMVRIYQKLHEKQLWSLFADLEVKLIPILAVMEVTGIQVNCDKLLHYADMLKAKISKVEASVHKTAGRPFSINSTVQLRQVLFDELHLDERCSRKLSKTHVQKQKSTSEAVLTQLQDLHPLPGLVLEYRQLCKMNATYVNGILPYISEGVLRPTWQHAGAATGRLVSSNPNIQAFPKHPISLGVVKEQCIVGKEVEEVKIDVREAVESRPGFSFVAADFKSIELRLLAHLSEDPTLIATLCSQDQTADVFTLLASEWLNMKPEEVTPADREKTKRVVYAVVYGVGKERLAEILGIHPNLAKDLMCSFLTKFPGVQQFIQKTVAECRKKECTVTICRRQRRFPLINSANLSLRSQAQRQAVNFPVQGSAADICKSAMLRVMHMLAQESPRTRLLMQIHDELLFEAPDEDVEELATKVKVVLESTTLLSYSLKVPLEVRVTVGKTWAALSPL